MGSNVPERRLLLCAVEFPPAGGGGVLRVVKLIKYLAPVGWSTTVLTAVITRPAVRDESLLGELPPETRIVRLPPLLSRATDAMVAAARTRVSRSSSLFGALSRVRRLLIDGVGVPDRWIGWALKAAHLPSATIGPFDAVVTSGPPHSVHVLGALIAKRTRKPLVMDIRDEWAMNPLYHSLLPGRALLDERIESWCLRRAHHVIVVSAVSEQRYLARYPSLAGRISVIPNGFDPVDIEHLIERQAVSPRETVIIGHAGSIHNRRDARPFLRVFGALVDRPDAQRLRLRLIGQIDAAQEAAARSIVAERALSIEPFLPHRAAVRELSACDILLVLTNEEEGGPAVLTGKIFEYLALRRPILAIAPPGAATQLIDEAGAGVHADPADPAAIRAAIHRAVELARDPQFRGANDGVLQRYDRRSQALRWAALLNGLVPVREGGAEPTG